MADPGLVSPGPGSHGPDGAGGLLLALPELNPLDWAAGAAVGAAADVWRNIMVGIWSAGLWLLHLAFGVIDAFTVPDVTANGPLAGALPTTLWLGLSVATLMMGVQLIVALVRRDSSGIGRVLLGIGQFGLVWLSFLTIGGVLIVAAGALTAGILDSMLQVGSWAEFSVGESWPRSINDSVAATILGLSSLVLLIPASFAYLLVMLVREAALVILIATAPISAAGLLSDGTKVWFWKSLRWFVACLLIAPAAALILGVGVQLSDGVVAGAGTDTVAAVGSAVVGCVLVMIGAICPMTLFKLLAFVEPGTGSGAALRQSMSDAGGVSGLLGGGATGSGSSGSPAATQTDGGGRSQGEAAAETQTTSRIAGLLGPVGAGIGAGMRVATKAADLASDVLGSAGVGDPGYSAGFADNKAKQQTGGQQTGGQQAGGQQQSGDTSSAPPADPGGGPPLASPPGPGSAGAGPIPNGPGAGAGGAGAAGGAAGGAGAEAAVLVV